MTIIVTTCATRKAAERIARTLVRERLVACVNLWPVRSIYRFKGKVQDEKEYALWCKTRKALAARARRRIKALHSYRVPVIEQWEAKVGAHAQSWLSQRT